jgi:hypothetical protein
MRYFEKFNLNLKMADGSAVAFKDITLTNARQACGVYVLDVEAGDVLKLSVIRQDGRPFTVDKAEYDFDLPLKNFNRFLVPDCGRYYDRFFMPLLSWGRTISMIGGNHGNPFAAFMNQHDEVVLGVGIIGKMVELGFTVTSPGRSVRNTLVVDHGRFRFQIGRPAGNFILGEFIRFEEALFVTEGDRSWFHALRKYAEAYYRISGKQFEILEEAFYPTWCSWVPWNSDDLDEQKVLDNARLAKDLGLRTIIIDDGWYGPGCDSASLESTMGDYRPDPKKFPDIQGTSTKIRALGLKSLLWVAPLAVSPEAECFEKLKHLLLVEKGKYWKSPSGFHDLCPACPAARQVILDKIPELLAYGFDGLKVDLYNNIGSEPCAAAHLHDCTTTTEGVMVLMKDYWARLKQLKPNAMMESKNNYANVYSAQFGSMTRGGDSPYDINNNFWNCVYPRAYAPIVHNDYLCWTPSETDTDLAILLIKQITAGVPTISADLAGMPENQKTVLRAWLALYNKYLDTFVRGILAPQSGAMDVWETANPQTAIISLLHDAKEFTWPAGKREVVVLNGTDNETIYVRAPAPVTATQTSLDHCLRETGGAGVSIVDKCAVNIPPAGVAIFKVKSKPDSGY